MQHISKFFAPLIAFLLVSSVGTAQNIQLTKGYYINLKGEKTAGFFETEHLRANVLKIWASQTDKKGKTLDIADVEKVVLQRSEVDTVVLLTQIVTFQEQPEKIYLEYLLRGDVNLLRGVSKMEKDIFFIYSTNLPKIRRINGVHPKTFLFAYFPKCDDVKKAMKKEIMYDREELEQAIIQLSNCANPYLFTNRRTESAKIESLKDASFGFKRYVSLGLTTTAGFMKVSMEPLSGTTYKATSILTSYGANIQVNLTNRLSLSAGINYGSSTLSTADSVNILVSTNPYTTYRFKAVPQLSYKKIEYIPFELKYRFIRNNRKLEPIISIGGIINQTKSPTLQPKNGNFTKELLNPNLPPSWYSTEPPGIPSLRTLYKNRGLGGFVTLGLQRQINKSLAFSLGGKYTFAHEIMVTPPVGLEISHREVFNYVQRFDIYAHLLFTLK